MGQGGQNAGMGKHNTALVLGAGIMGLCAAWALRGRGWSVRIIDQAVAPNPRGASVDHHRLIRHAYGAQAGYMRMVDDAYAAWGRLFADLGEAPYVQTGVLALGESAGPGWLRDSRAAMAGHGLAVTDLSAAAVAEAFPIFSGAGIGQACHVAEGGVLLAGRIVELLARHLAAHGVVFEQGRALEVGDGLLRLADGSTREADALVVAAGPWAPRLLPALAGRVTASRQIIVRLAPPEGLTAAWARAPMLLDLSEGAGFYLVPPVAGTPIKLGDHSFSRQGDAQADPREASAAEAEAILALARHRIPRLSEYRRLGAHACYYDVQEQEEFVVEPIAPRSLVMSGFSGHGFKFGAVLGQAVANALSDPSLLPCLPDWAAGRAPAPARLLQPESLPA
jgi:sarcosine oxidase subunit beta